MNETNSKLRYLSYGVIIYMLIAFSWWSVLLFIKNTDAFQAKRDLMKLGMIAEGVIKSDEEFYRSERYLTLEKQYEQQEWMILGEAAVFVLSLVIGVWLINRGYHKEMVTARQRRNFLLSITHELKSPLASIRLVLETLLKRELSREQTAKFVQNGLHDTERLTTLVNDLLLSAKLETAYQPQYEPLDLAELFRELMQKMSDTYPQATFSFDSQPDLPPILADRVGLNSVGINLLENAVKYGPAKPRINVSLLTVNNRLQIDIADNGTGIPDSEKKKIFAKFYRLGNEDTRQTKGTGLGLFIVAQIIKTHRGNIVVLDNQPSGSIFRIRLPLENPEA